MMDKGGQKFYYACNALYSVSALTDAAGNVVERYKYEPYGAVTVLNGDGSLKTTGFVGNPYTFTGQRLDGETGLMYYKNRYYDVDLGRFVGRDPIRYRGSKWSLYEYAASQPQGALDSFGQKPCKRMAILMRSSDYKGPFKKLGELMTSTSKVLDDGECIGTLEIQGHGTPRGMTFDLNAERNDAHSYSANRIDAANASYVGGELKTLCFCCPCTIILTACNVGLLKPASLENDLEEPWTQLLADATGCTVKAAGGYTTGTVHEGTIDIHQTSIESGESYVENEVNSNSFAGQDDKWYVFEPRQKRRNCGCCCNVAAQGKSTPEIRVQPVAK